MSTWAGMAWVSCALRATYHGLMCIFSLVLLFYWVYIYTALCTYLKCLLQASEQCSCHRVMPHLGKLAIYSTSHYGSAVGFYWVQSHSVFRFGLLVCFKNKSPGQTWPARIFFCLQGFPNPPLHDIRAIFVCGTEIFLSYLALSCYGLAWFIIPSPLWAVFSIIFSTQNAFIVLNYIFPQGESPFMFLVIIDCFVW